MQGPGRSPLAGRAPVSEVPSGRDPHTPGLYFSCWPRRVQRIHCLTRPPSPRTPYYPNGIELVPRAAAARVNISKKSLNKNMHFLIFVQRYALTNPNGSDGLGVNMAKHDQFPPPQEHHKNLPEKELLLCLPHRVVGGNTPRTANLPQIAGQTRGILGGGGNSTILLFGSVWLKIGGVLHKSSKPRLSHIFGPTTWVPPSFICSPFPKRESVHFDCFFCVHQGFFSLVKAGHGLFCFGDLENQGSKIGVAKRIAARNGGRGRS